VIELRHHLELALGDGQPGRGREGAGHSEHACAGGVGSAAPQAAGRVGRVPDDGTDGQRLDEHGLHILSTIAPHIASEEESDERWTSDASRAPAHRRAGGRASGRRDRGGRVQRRRVARARAADRGVGPRRLPVPVSLAASLGIRIRVLLPAALRVPAAAPALLGWLRASPLPPRPRVLRRRAVRRAAGVRRVAPARARARPAGSRRDQRITFGGGRAMPQTVLVVDDEPRIAAIAADYLRHAGYSVLTASEGTAAL